MSKNARLRGQKTAAPLKPVPQMWILAFRGGSPRSKDRGYIEATCDAIAVGGTEIVVSAVKRPRLH